jgi:phospholipid/cholesterol/gamma-HCH transport system substrate-binding protein
MPRTRSLAWSELKLGVIGVVALVLLALIVLSVGGKGGFFWQRYPLKTRFADVQGMKTGAVVRVAGKEVGSVTSIEFVGAQVEIAMKISDSVRPLITDKSVARIGSLSLLGEPIIEIQAATEGKPLANWSYLPGAIAKGSVAEMADNAMRNLDIAGALLSDVRAGRGTVGKLFTDEELYSQLRQLTTASAEVVRNLQKGNGTLGALMNDDAVYKSLKTSVDNLQTVTDKISRGEGPLGRLVNDDAMGRNLSATTANVEQLTDRLNKGQGTAGKLMNDTQLYDQFTSVANRLDRIASGLDGGKGTAGQLLNDKQLYDNLNHAASELQSLIADIRKDPKKYLNVRVSIF